MHSYGKLFAVWIMIAALLACSCAAEAKSKKKLTEAEALEASVKREIAIGDKVAEEVAQHMNFIEDPFVTARVRGIFNRLTPWVSRPLPYNVHVVEEKSPNAFCIPGGNIYVTTGLIDFARSDAELAFVIAHELSHADGKHVIIQTERNQKLSLAALAVILASRGAGAAMVLSNVAAVAVANAYSRDLEQQADLGAVEIAQKAGYDLTAGVTVMERLAAEELKQPWIDPGIALDHPKLADRIGYIAEAVEKTGHVIRRKNVLKFLLPCVTEENGELILTVDSTEIVRGPKSDALQKYLDAAAETITLALQMETPAYDIRISKNKEKSALYIGVSRFMESPVPGTAITMEEIRSRLLRALTEAQKKHPLANYNL